MTNFFETLFNNKDQIFSLFIQHIGLTVLAVILAVLIGVPTGILITKSEKLSKPILVLANVIQAVPSLALLGFLIPIIGIGSPPAIIMVVLYSLLPIIKNTYTGLSSINPDIIESAKGMGLTRNQTLRLIKLPLAMPIIMAGVRIAAVTAVGLMTIAAFIGAGGLGYLVFSGIQTVNNALILSGAIPAAILALIIDYITGKIERSVTPNGIKDSKGVIKRRKKSKLSKKTLILCLCIVSLIGVSTFLYNIYSNRNSITIASKNYTEQLILGNMYADLVEAKTDYKVNRKMNLGGSQVTFQAITSGEIDMYAEYVGTFLINILNEDINMDKDKAYPYVKKTAMEKYNLKMLDKIGFNNTYALAVKREFAESKNIKTISDLAKYSKDLIISPTIEFSKREDGLVGLEKNYPNLKFKEVIPVDGGLRYTSLDSNKCQVIDAFTTDGLLKAHDLVVLEDDKNFFPPYHVAPLIRNDLLKEHPDLEKVFNMLNGVIDDKTMIELNYKVDKEGKRPEDVAMEFLKEKGLI